ncbi:tyrosine-type recombinase/integrase [Bremerella sp. T1]|uniref:tyrosine-type recombinase/integrase n=1 Tax=Bremerella sp. TYQ1 TaxID=3119568 RepID=UPI001CCA5C7B|nr:site-specific integrase [Bremerella volcania]UBM38161.1 site-specific integrase [Bremerella volcania]
MKVWRKTTTRYQKEGKRCSKETPGAKRVREQSKRFYGTLKTASGKTRQVPLTEERGTALKLLRRLQGDEDRYRAIGIDNREQKRSLDELLVEYEKSLKARNITAGYIITQMKRIRELVGITKAKTLDDLNALQIEKTLANWREKGRTNKHVGRIRLTISSTNHYSRAIKGFTRWAWIEKKANEDVLRNLRLLNARADKKRERRALTNQEIRRLIQATKDSRKSVCGLNAVDRAMLYTIAAYTGLRTSELASLKTNSIDLENNTITVEAGYSKRRCKDVLPLHASLVESLRLWLESKAKERTKSLFARRWAKKRHGASMIRSDLKRANIDYVDANGKYADFHSLRHTFISSLARSGVHSLKAKELARHSTITLTMDVYSHIETDELRKALDMLPAIG